MLVIDDIHAGYGATKVLFGLSLEAAAGEVMCLVGRNGAGKSTTIKSIMGLLPVSQGQISLDGEVISSLAAEEVPRRGVGLVPQGRRLFAELTVAENLEVGLMVKGSSRKVRDDALDIFPRLRERLTQPAATLSGGEQQMLATARALCLEPKLLLLDEPTEGLQPSMIDQIHAVVRLLRDRGVAILLVEQRMDAILSLADKVAFVEHGQVKETVAANALSADAPQFTQYLGVS